MFEELGPETSGPAVIDRQRAEVQLRRAQAGNLAVETAGKLQDMEDKARVQEAFAKLAAARGTPGARGAAVGALGVLAKSPGAGHAMAQEIYEDAQTFRALGQPEKAAKLEAEGALVESRVTGVAQKAATADRAIREKELKEIGYANSLLSGIASLPPGQRAAAWEGAKLVLSEQLGDIGGLAGMPYSEQRLAAITRALTTEHQKHQERVAEGDQRTKDANRRSAIGFREFRKGVLGEELKLREAREERLAKNAGGAGKAVGLPSDNDVKTARRLIVKEIPEAGKLDAPDLELFGYNVAARAKALLQERKGVLDAGTAMALSLQEQKKDLQVIAGRFKDSAKYLGRGGSSPELALPLPPESKDRVPGKYYVTPDGPKRYARPVGMEGYGKRAVSGLVTEEEEEDDE